jgi:hypothetical protein
MSATTGSSIRRAICDGLSRAVEQAPATSQRLLSHSPTMHCGAPSRAARLPEDYATFCGHLPSALPDGIEERDLIHAEAMALQREIYWPSKVQRLRPSERRYLPITAGTTCRPPPLRLFEATALAKTRPRRSRAIFRRRHRVVERVHGRNDVLPAACSLSLYEHPETRQLIRELRSPNVEELAGYEVCHTSRHFKKTRIRTLAAVGLDDTQSHYTDDDLSSRSSHSLTI